MRIPPRAGPASSLDSLKCGGSEVTKRYPTVSVSKNSGFRGSRSSFCQRPHPVDKRVMRMISPPSISSRGRSASRRCRSYRAAEAWGGALPLGLITDVLASSGHWQPCADRRPAHRRPREPRRQRRLVLPRPLRPFEPSRPTARPRPTAGITSMMPTRPGDRAARDGIGLPSGHSRPSTVLVVAAARQGQEAVSRSDHAFAALT